MTRVRPANPVDLPRLLEIWERSVRATHHFLTEADIGALLPTVRDVALHQLAIYVLCDDSDAPVGFMGLAPGSLEALFLHPDFLRRGGGRQLLQHARHLQGPLRTDVNEQNEAALQFYLANGFVVTGRSDLDTEGRPFPLLHLTDAPTRPSS